MPSPLRPSTTRAHSVVVLLYAAFALAHLVLPSSDPGDSGDPATTGSGSSSSHSATTDDTSASRPASAVSQDRVDAARDAGCTMADTALRAARDADIPYYVGCAFLQQETDGGRNVFGHDPTVFAGAGEVTKSKYLAYKKVRERTGQMQGVGPMQLTWYTYQDRADELGGAWKPYPNMLVGFRHLAALHRASGSWTVAAHEYNGGGPAADAYAAQLAERLGQMRSAIG